MKKSNRFKSTAIAVVGAILGIVFSLIVIAFLGVLTYALSVNNEELISLIDNRTTLAVCLIVMTALTSTIVLLNVLGRKSGGSAREREKDGGNFSSQRFHRLSEIDKIASKNGGKIGAPDFDDDVDLEKFCTDFRNFAASRLHLCYDISTIRAFVSGLAVSRLLIMQGISGTGKTSLACAFASFIGNDPVVVPVQPSWKERTDLLGYFNEFTKNYNETILLEKIYEAGYSDGIYVTVLDEMNIARVEYYFAEFLSLLEMRDPKNRMIEVVSDTWQDDPKRLIDGRLQLPDNMWYVGTANNDDSTLSISDKVCDRAMILDFDSRASAFEAPDTPPIRISAKRFDELVRNAQSSAKMSDLTREKIEKLDLFLLEKFGITFGNRILRQIGDFIPVFIACGGSEEEAVDYLLAKKVLRKLEAKNPLFVRRAVPEFLSFLDETFGENSLPVCRKTVEKYIGD